ncbi:MAG: betaine--homocysteine S-methyltransferase [Anaerolineae bacterium]
MKAALADLLGEDGPIITDGSMITALAARGLRPDAHPGLWNLTHPRQVSEIHRAFTAAGAHIILTNSARCSRIFLSLYDLDGQVTVINRAAARLARQAADAAPGPVLVAGAIGPAGEMLVPYGTLDYHKAREAFEEQARCLAEGGVDLFWIDTMIDLKETQAAIEGCRSAAPELPVVATLSFEYGGRTLMDYAPAEVMEALWHYELTAVGASCGNGIDEILVVIKEMRTFDPLAILAARADAGLCHICDGQARYNATPEEMAAYALAAHELGAKLIGGCCGCTAEHIRAIAQALTH